MVRSPNSRIFSLAEARALLGWLREVSESAELDLVKLQSAELPREQAQAQALDIIQHWGETVVKLGALPKQPFTVDFDSGRDYFCWEYPEDDVYYRHAYHLGYQGRVRIDDQEKCEEPT